MNKALLAVLNDSERLLVAETEVAELQPLDEDAVLDLHARVRKARNKYIGQYRRQASGKVAKKGGRGKARPTNQRARQKAEAFEEALSRVSRRLAVLSRQAAADLRTERLAAAAGEAGKAPRAATRVPSNKRTVTQRPTGDRALRSPASVKRKASTEAVGARRQAKRDSR